MMNDKLKEFTQVEMSSLNMLGRKLLIYHQIQTLSLATILANKNSTVLMNMVIRINKNQELGASNSMKDILQSLRFRVETKSFLKSTTKTI